MPCRGVHFSLDDATVRELKSLGSDRERKAYVQERIEADYFQNHPEWLAETDKAWDFIHRALTDGKLGVAVGSYPLSYVVLGGEHLYRSDEYIMSLKTAEEVTEVADALRLIDDAVFTKRFDQVPARALAHSREQDLGYSLAWFGELKAFWLRAAEERRAVLFTVDQ